LKASNTVEEIKNENSKPSGIEQQSTSIFDEMKNVQLKNLENPQKVLKEDSNILKQSLTEAIKQRRMDLTKHDVDEEDDDDSDWSD